MSGSPRFPLVLIGLLAAFLITLAPPGDARANESALLAVAETENLDPNDPEAPRFLVLPALSDEGSPDTAAASVDANLPALPPSSGYDESVRNALRKMGLTSQHLDLWASSHPGSALRDLPVMVPTMQRSVANIALYIRAQNRRVSPKVAWREAAALVKYSGRYGLPLPLAVAVAHAESTFDPNTVSSRGAMGVMQVVWRVHNGLLSSHGIADSKRQMSDPERGIAAGCLLLSRYLNAYGTVKKAIDRYYGGVAVGYWQALQNHMQRLVAHAARSGL
jgi:soluble lytic murein transglycosylase-like protein